MKQKELNLVEILKDKSKDTPVWSPIFGEGLLKEVNHVDITIETREHVEWYFAPNGHVRSYPEVGELLIFPSEKMRDWEKYQWKKGDILYNSDARMYAMFDGWTNDDYTEFNTTYNYYGAPDVYFGEEEVCDTESFEKCDDATVNIVICKLEKHYGGKFNHETMEVENVHDFKPFDMVLVRDKTMDIWRAAFFEKFTANAERPYTIIGDVDFRFCIPYEGNEKLLYTNLDKNYKKAK